MKRQDMAAARQARTVKRGAPLSWRVLIYRVPTEPASKRVAVWRDLKRLGALYLQQCACIFPDIPGLTDEVQQARPKFQRLERCQGLLSSFEEEVYRRQAADTRSAASTKDEVQSDDGRRCCDLSLRCVQSAGAVDAQAPGPAH